MNGSAMLAVAETVVEVIEHLKHDIYCKSGVWDLEKVQIYPVSFHLLYSLVRSGREDKGEKGGSLWKGIMADVCDI